jgi:hypothetical protein
MAKNGKFSMLAGPLDAKRKPGASLGGEDVHQEGPKSTPDPLGYVKAKGARKSAEKNSKEMSY